jgi:hypothetical protein
MLNKIDKLAIKKGWTIEKKSTPKFDLPESIANRYGSFPADWTEFISNIDSFINQVETVWFLCSKDYKEQDENSFRWNELELISLQAADDYGDEECQDNIRQFWDAHLPIVLSVGNDYEYFAIRLSDGFIVYGYEPEFEEYEEVAKSFIEFVEKIISREIDL